ncbi:leucine-rich repeat protein 1-like [Bidens hawaiensis]|uniref:leucine-rich repeat protein 1-like n=1 Tax=Bidens hawaiensis TaxID=980011 RepID=UPI004049577D
MAWSTLPAMIFTLSAVTSKVTFNSDVDALYALRQSLNDPDNALQSWDPSNVDPCTWFYVTCDQDNRVTHMDLGYHKLSGSLVPELGNVDSLQYLALYGNNIQGSIPQEIGNLKNLISLDLYNNSITGNIPSTLGNLKSLEILRVNDNRLTGTIPMELAGISSLAAFDVSNNDLCGPIPSTGPFEHIPPSSFESNPRLGGPC